jgi:hypothetical protein
MVGDPEGSEAELLHLLWSLQHRRHALDMQVTDDRERWQSTVDQNELQIVRCLALLALVRQSESGERDTQ